MPGRFAETVGLDDSFDFFFLGRIPTGSAGYAGQECARRWASHQTRLGRAKGPLGEPTFTRPPHLLQSCACLARCLLAPGCLCLLGTVPARHIFFSVPARHCASSARLEKCPLGTVPARHLVRCPLSTAPPREVLQDVRPTYGSLTEKNRGRGSSTGLNHMHNMQAVPRVMQNKLFHVSCKKTSCSTCKNHAKKKLFHMQNHAKNKLFHMQKPCKNHAKCGAYGAPTRRTLPGFLAICAICAISHKASR